MLRRLGFIILFCCGGFLFYIPKWILVGTKGGRDRKRMAEDLAAIRARGERRDVERIA